jgi:hypothetical protein
MASALSIIEDNLPISKKAVDESGPKPPPMAARPGARQLPGNVTRVAADLFVKNAARIADPRPTQRVENAEVSSFIRCGSCHLVTQMVTELRFNGA